MNYKYMKLALKEAQKAFELGEIPVGTVIVKDNQIIAKAHNQKEKKQNVLKHAELIAIEKASKKLNNWRLNECDIYITLFPCPMCASAIQQSRIKNVYYVLSSVDKNSVEAVEKIFLASKNNKAVNIYKLDGNIEIQNLLQNFFEKKR